MFTTTGAVRGGLISAAMFVLLTGSAQAQTSLKYKFKEGDKLNYTMDQTQKQMVNVMGMEIETTMTQNMEMSWNVKSVKDGKAQMTQTIDRIRMKMDSPFAAFEFDSKDGKEPEGPVGQLLGPLFAAMAGAEFTVTMNEQGEVSETKVSEKLLEAMKANPALQQLGGGFTEEGLKNMMTQSGGSILPKTAVKKGDTWDQKIELKQPPLGVMKMNSTYTYGGPEEKDGATLEKIGVKTEITIEPIENAAAQFEIKVKSADMKGTLYFDNKAGRLVVSTMNQKMNMEINAMGNIIESVVDQTITVKLAK
jgi:hypothetical protein